MSLGARVGWVFQVSGAPWVQDTHADVWPMQVAVLDVWPMQVAVFDLTSIHRTGWDDASYEAPSFNQFPPASAF